MAATGPRTLQNVIGGVAVDVEAERRYDVVDPATGAPIALTADSTAADVDRAVGAARAAFGSWSVDAPVFAADVLPAGAIVAGPAILDSETSTIVVPPGDSLQADGLGNFLLTVC